MNHTRLLTGILLLGISSGFPLGLTATTLQAWLAAEKISIATIGSLAFLGLPYSLKFLWAPFIDRYRVPFAGRRGGWILLCQALLACSIPALGAVDPHSQMYLLVILAFAVTFLSASQDIAIDSLRTDVLPQSEYGNGAAYAVLGYRLGMLCSTSVTLILSDHISWFLVYCSTVPLLLLGVLGLYLMGKEPELASPKEHSFAGVFWNPLKDFFTRPFAKSLLLFVFLYKVGDVLAVCLSTPFLMEIGFSRSEIGAINKGVGLLSSIAGGLIGGHIIKQFGLRISLVLAGWLQSLSILLFLWIAWAGNDRNVLILAIAGENATNGIGNAALVALLMLLCNKQYSATQLSLLTSVTAVARVTLASSMGHLQGYLLWPKYFIFCWLISLPGMVMLHYLGRRWFASFKPSSEELSQS
jgi:MFS transporter, PAT family, beta-lactamase induction signal transducer AmpG